VSIDFVRCASACTGLPRNCRGLRPLWTAAHQPEAIAEFEMTHLSILDPHTVLRGGADVLNG
jgi:hypothetical protein